MSTGLIPLIWTAAGIGFIHTLAGPDHYLPFVMLGRARGWPLVKTLWITGICGLGHVAGSVLLGLIGIGMGLAIHELVSIESLRGELAAWALLAFGLGYLAWGIRLAYRRRPHSHSHYHLDGSVHEHQHQHKSNHTHLHLAMEGGSGATPWALFVIFVLGPCEPLIPVLIFPASSASLTGILLVSAVFGLVTITTMIAITALLVLGARQLRLEGLGRWSHALAGSTLFLSGLFMIVIQI